MQDLSSISKALHEVIDSPGADEEKLTSTIERFLISNDPAVRVAAVVTLAGILDDIKNSNISDADTDAKLRLIFEETALAFIPALLPILPDSTEEVGSLVLQSAETGKPREVIMALNEALQYVLDRTENAYLSDEEDEGNEEPNYTDLGREVMLIIRCYEIAIHRLNNKKSTSTIMALSDALSPVFRALYENLDEKAARAIIHGLCRLVSAAWDWAQTTEDAKGEQKAILTNLHLTAVTLFGPRVGATLLESWFLTTFPRYDYTGEEAKKPKHDLRCGRMSRVPGLMELHLALGTARNLGVDPEDMHDRLIHPSSTNPHSAIAALILMSAQGHFEDTFSITPTLGDCMPVLSAALSSVAIDAGCTLLWSLVHGGCAVSSDEATLLIELLMPLIAFPSNDTTRTALLKLLEAIVVTQSTEAKLQILKELLESINPYDSIRLATFPILRQNLISDPSLLSSTTFETLSPILFVIPTDDNHLEQGLQEVSLEVIVTLMYPSWFTECANLLWFLYDLDKENQTGIRNQETLAKIRKEWLDPIASKVEEWIKEAGIEGGEARLGFVLQRLKDALERASQTIGR